MTTTPTLHTRAADWLETLARWLAKPNSSATVYAELPGFIAELRAAGDAQPARAADMPTTEQLLREAIATLRAFIKPLRAMGHQSDAIDAAPDLMARIDAYLAQQSALDELVRENERLGLYDDQKPAQETKCACSPDMYVAGYTGGAAPEGLFGKLYVYIEGASRSVEYAPVAAPSPAQPRQPLSEWIACSERLPEHDALRVIVYCTADRPENRMWCAIWNAGDQSFEADGGWFERDEITHWQPAPKRPIERAITGEKS